MQDSMEVWWPIIFGKHFFFCISFWIPGYIMNSLHYLKISISRYFSPFLPIPFSLATIGLFSTSMALFLLCLFICFLCTYEWNHMVFCLPCPTYFSSTKPSRFIHVVASDKISFFFIIKQYSIFFFIYQWTPGVLPYWLL